MIAFEEQRSLAEFTSYKIGGPARYFFRANTEEEVREALARAREERLRVFVLGGGTNLLISEEGFPGLVLKPDLTHIVREGDAVRVGAGVLVKDLLEFLIQQSLAGFEWAGGLPGTVGGAVRGNAGAFGGETKDSVSHVTSIADDTGAITVRTNAECAFGYRTSIFKTNDNEVVLETTFAFRAGNAADIGKSVREKIDYRLARHPMEYPNAGSVFKNVPLAAFPESARADFANVVKQDPFPVVPTAYLVAESGMKGVREGRAMVSEKHTNFIVNTGGATAAEVKALMRKVQDAVRAKFGIMLEPEVMEL